MISAPKEHNKRIKASHAINRCGWLFLLCEYYFLCYSVYSIVGTPYSAEDCATYNPDQQTHKYNGKEFDTTHGLNTYDYGARQYNSLVGRWDRMDQLAERDYATSP